MGYLILGFPHHWPTDGQWLYCSPKTPDAVRCLSSTDTTITASFSGFRGTYSLHLFLYIWDNNFLLCLAPEKPCLPFFLNSANSSVNSPLNQHHSVQLFEWAMCHLPPARVVTECRSIHANSIKIVNRIVMFYYRSFFRGKSIIKSKVLHDNYSNGRLANLPFLFLDKLLFM